MLSGECWGSKLDPLAVVASYNPMLPARMALSMFPDPLVVIEYRDSRLRGYALYIILCGQELGQLSHFV